jgi:hypothetical protein
MVKMCRPTNLRLGGKYYKELANRWLFWTRHLQGSFDGQDRIKIGYDIELDRDMI